MRDVSVQARDTIFQKRRESHSSAPGDCLKEKGGGGAVGKGHPWDHNKFPLTPHLLFSRRKKQTWPLPQRPTQ